MAGRPLRAGNGPGLGVWSGTGMVVANMVGAGVFVSTGSMVDSLTPGQILAAWAVGTLIALAGARAYSGLVRLVPLSGGEYRFLSTLVHPALGYLAGWASLLLGFSAPIAISVTAMGVFAQTLHPGLNPLVVAALAILTLTTVHAVGLRCSLAAQNTLVALKLVLVAGFIVVGLVCGTNTWTDWTPPGRADGTLADPILADPIQADPVQTESDRSDRIQPGGIRPEPLVAEAGRPGTVQAQTVHPGPNQTGSNKTGQIRAGAGPAKEGGAREGGTGWGVQADVPGTDGVLAETIHGGPSQAGAIQSGAEAGAVRHEANAAGFPIRAFMLSLFYIAFTFSGWNAAVYAASEFRNPQRDVPRAMLLGCALVGILYLCINWIFVTNLPPAEQARIAAAYYGESARITLGHRIMENLLGEAGGVCMSVLAIIAFISSASAMTYLGPRVYAAMARDGFLPAALAGRDGQPPVGAVLLQGGVALFLTFAYSVQEILSNVGALLTLFSALAVFSLFWGWIRRETARPDLPTLLAAGFYLGVSAVMLSFGLRGSATLYLWVLACAGAALIGYGSARKRTSRS